MGRRSSAHLRLRVARFNRLGVYVRWKKIKDNEVRCAILDDLHIVMYMPIEPNESIETFMTCRRNKIIESFIQHLPGDSWIQYFWTYYFQVDM